MKNTNSLYLASIVIAGVLASSAITAATRSTPVSVVNDASTPVPVTVQSSSGAQFVGFTTATFDGGQGVATYTNACSTDYAGSHMCTSEEFLNTKTFTATSGGGWIRPTHVPSPNRNADMSGSQSESCNGWSYTGTGTTDGLYVDFSGRFTVSSCLTVKSVACCL